MSKNHKNTNAAPVNNNVDSTNTKETTMSTTQELMKQVAALTAVVEELKHKQHSPTRDDGMVYTIPPALSESTIKVIKTKQARCIMTGLIKLRAEKIEQKLCTSATFTFTRSEWSDASVRLGGLETKQGADRVNIWYLKRNPKFQLLEDDTMAGSLNMIQRAQ